MDHLSPRHPLFRNRVLGPSFSLGGNLFLFFTLGLIGQEGGFYTILIIFAVIIVVIRLCKRYSESENSQEETDVESAFTQSPVRPSLDVETQEGPHSLGPMNKYPKTCPSCGKPLEEEIMKQLIISGQTKCMFCGGQILTSKKS